MKKFLFLGAGVLGSLYAARLKQSGQDVTLLARNTRLKDIKEHGIVLEHALSGKREVVTVPVVEHLDENDAYDLIVVLVRKNQVASVLPILASHTATPNILFMVNNPSGYADWANAVGSERLVLGFAGAGGTLVDNVVRYVVVPRLLQPTTFGELDGSCAKLQKSFGLSPCQPPQRHRQLMNCGHSFLPHPFPVQGRGDSNQRVSDMSLWELLDGAP